LAARRVGIREVILPKQNAKNVNEDLTPELRQDMTVHLVSSIDEVLAMALQPVSSDLRSARKDSKDAKEPKSGARMAVRPLTLSQQMVDGFRLIAGGTIETALIACGRAEFGIQNSDGIGSNSEIHNVQCEIRSPQSAIRNVACHIGGGLHHAFPNHGEGFCPFNDVAVAIRVLQQRGIARAAVVDLDVHHGNGTAFIFESDPSVFA